MSFSKIGMMRVEALGLSADERERASFMFASLQARFRPLDVMDGFHVEEIVFAHLKLARTDAVQMRILDGRTGRQVDPLKVIADLDRYRRSLRRDIETAERRLTKAASVRAKQASTAIAATERRVPATAAPRVVH